MNHRKNAIPPGTLHKAGEDYLEAILVLQMEKGNVHAIDIAHHLQFSKPSVSNAVSVLREVGYLTVDENRLIHLTDAGRNIAEHIYERHQFFSRLLIHLGVDAKIAEEDACRIEHVISSESFEKLKEYALEHHI